VKSEVDEFNPSRLMLLGPSEEEETAIEEATYAFIYQLLLINIQRRPRTFTTPGINSSERQHQTPLLPYEYLF
jgi:hypothetical protein